MSGLAGTSRRQRAAVLLGRVGLGTQRGLWPITAGIGALLVGLIAAAFWITGKEREADDAVALTVSNEDRLAVVQSLLQDAEIGQRGYLLTGDSLYLEPYTRSVEEVEKELDGLEAGTSDNSRQQANVAALRPIVAEKLSELRQTVERRRSGDTAGALAILETGQGKALMDGVRDIVTRMRDEEGRLLTERNAASRRSAFRMEASIIALVLAVAAMALIAWRATVVRARAAEASRDELIARLDRRLMAVMAADVVGYSGLMERDESHTLEGLRRLVADERRNTGRNGLSLPTQGEATERMILLVAGLPKDEEAIGFCLAACLDRLGTRSLEA